MISTKTSLCTCKKLPRGLHWVRFCYENDKYTHGLHSSLLTVATLPQPETSGFLILGKFITLKLNYVIGQRKKNQVQWTPWCACLLVRPNRGPPWSNTQFLSCGASLSLWCVPPAARGFFFLSLCVLFSVWQRCVNGRLAMLPGGGCRLVFIVYLRQNNY